MLLDDLKADVLTSMKKGDHVRVDTLRFLLAAIRNAAISKYQAAGEAAMKDEDVLDVIKKQVKTHKESIEAFTKASRNELVLKEQGELTILEAFLPKEMTDEELKKLLEPVAKSGESNFGLLMKQAMQAVAGRADGGRVSSMLKQLI
ncbi:MAG: hypothetical protein UV58_C0025G0016 [Candidatus Wolfebacteria bacterium GW2011_GWC1_43_10]|uniref:GatB/YqeY domain-containing protein n=1 Tax=Candidatus Wolfebacteria bacterium GW2011_GWC1_43_10 TaxID=1619011 RepID=A0A0G1C771_9BACT|nr:MAG: hypothetical protein UU25_C0029G0006 [Microgenomates group bacterium GW2011_GWB1_40_9]KKS81239.1 MAG: hypothetical protein UV58_C0025G0016 [Candidatus Wolfebacteria bacterium GW2011_GWC1_43_10]